MDNKILDILEKYLGEELFSMKDNKVPPVETTIPDKNKISGNISKDKEEENNLKKPYNGGPAK